MKNDCRQVQQLWLEEAEGRPLSAEEQSLIAQHREACRFCRAEQDWIRAAGYDGESGPAPALDDLACRRWVDDILDHVEEAPEARQSDAPRRGFRWVVAAAAATTAAAAAILLIVGSAALWWVFHEPGTPAATDAAAPVAVVTNPDPALLLLLSGGLADVDGETPRVGDPLPAGALLTIGDGGAVVQLQEGLRVSLENGSFSYQPSLGDSLEITLNGGKLYLLADPERPGGTVDVFTRTGKVRVTGTYLSVQDGANAVAVEVYRGSVQVTAADDVPLAVTGGQRHLIGSGKVRTMDEPTSQRASQVQDLLRLLGRSRYTTMEVRSIPAGATVSLDGCPLGSTPLTARVVAGSHKLELEAEHHVPSREFVQLAEGATEARTIELLALTTFEKEPVAAPVVTAPAVHVASDAELAARLLEQAQALRAERSWSDAAATYRQLTEQFPQTPEARASWISLGAIQLDHLGQPAEALRSFDTYLAVAHGGSLEQEACYERARALRTLGDRQGELDAWQLFLDRFPDALEAQLARQYMEQAP